MSVSTTTQYGNPLLVRHGDRISTTTQRGTARRYFDHVVGGILLLLAATAILLLAVTVTPVLSIASRVGKRTAATGERAIAAHPDTATTG